MLLLMSLGIPVSIAIGVAALAGVAIATGPRRLVRWAGVVLPLVMRLRR